MSLPWATLTLRLRWGEQPQKSGCPLQSLGAAAPPAAPARKRTPASRLPAAPSHQTPHIAGGGEEGDSPPGSPHRAAGGMRALGPVGLTVSWAAGRGSADAQALSVILLMDSSVLGVGKAGGAEAHP